MESPAKAAPKQAKADNSKKQLLTNAASFFVNNVLNTTVLLWLQQYLFKRLPAEEFSLYPLVMSILMLLPTLSMMLQDSMSRFSAEAHAKGDLERVTALTSTLAPICAALGAVVMTIGILCSVFVEHVLVVPPGLEGDAGLMVFIVFAIFVLDIVGLPFRVGLFIRARFVLFNGIEALTQVVRVTVLFILLFGVSTRVLWVLVAYAVAQIVRHSLLLRNSQRLVPELRFDRSKIDWSLTKILASYGWWSLLVQVSYSIRSSMDVLVLNRLATPQAVNEFYLGSMGYKQVQRLWDPVRSSLGPPLIQMYARGEHDRLSRAYLRGGRFAIWLMMFVAAPLIAFAQETMHLYLGSDEMWRAGIVMVLLLTTLPIEAGNIMQRSIVRATGQIRAFAIGTASAQAVGLILRITLLLVTDWGSIGSAVATLVTCVIFEPALLLPLGLKATNTSPLRYFRETMIPGIIPGVGAAIAMIAIGYVFPIDTWLKLGAGAAAGAVVYVAILWLVMQPADRADLLAVRNKLPFLKKKGVKA